MNAPAKVRHWQRQAQIRITLIHCLIGLPLLCGAVLLAVATLALSDQPAVHSIRQQSLRLVGRFGS